MIIFKCQFRINWYVEFYVMYICTFFPLVYGVEDQTSQVAGQVV